MTLPFETENKAINVMKSASLLNKMVLSGYSLDGMLHFRKSGIKAHRVTDNTIMIICPKLVLPGSLIQVARYLPQKSPQLKSRKTETAVKYFLDQSLPES